MDKNSVFGYDDTSEKGLQTPVACVGSNGAHPSYIVSGFLLAAEILVDQVLAKPELYYETDLLIYPISYQVRHAVELCLKFGIEQLLVIAEIKDINCQIVSVWGHDLKKLWETFRNESEKIDHRYTKINEVIHSIVSDIHKKDPTGEAFRYFKDEEGKMLLEGGSFSFSQLKNVISTLKESFEKLNGLHLFLIEEYKTQTFTPELSRYQLFKLAFFLREKGFMNTTDRKNSCIHARKYFKIGGNKLNKALDKIKTHYELSAILGQSVSLDTIDAKLLIIIFNYWVKAREIDEPSFIDLSDCEHIAASFEAHNQKEVIKTELWEINSQRFSDEVVACLCALFYLLDGSNYYFSEYYEMDYDYFLTNLKKEQKNSKEQFFHIYSKTNFVERIVQSLYYLKQTIILEELIDYYNSKLNLKIVYDSKTLYDLTYENPY